MKKLTSAEIAAFSGGRLLSGDGKRTGSKAVIDSREASEGTVFFAIRGQNHDAHKFIPDAVRRGCGIVVVSDETIAAEGCDVIQVEDTLKALHRLASRYMRELDVRTVAVTGSVGKTSTRDLIAAGLQARFRTYKSGKNYNNQYGLPLSVLSIDPRDQVAVLEMGMEQRGEIHELADIVRPDIAVITNIGISHMEKLGSRQGIMEAKMEIADFFHEDNVLVVNGGDDMLGQLKDKSYRIVKSGSCPDAMVRVKEVRDRGASGIDVSMEAEGEPLEISLRIPGAHNGENLALALTACRLMGATYDESAKAMENACLTGNRLRVLSLGGVTVIDDSYNAAPVSVESALKTLMATEGKRHVAMLGSMAELGSDSERLHEETGRKAAGMGLDLLITVGENARALGEGAKKAGLSDVLYVDRKEDLYPEIGSILREEDAVLVKGSRTMELERLVDAIAEAVK